MSKFWLPVLLVLIASSAEAREQIRVVGSSTVYPFVAAAAEQFGRGTNFKTPVVESTGTGGGIKLFCSGTGNDTPDVANASRRMKQSEFDLCHKNGVNEIMEIELGFDGIALVFDKSEQDVNLTRKAIFLALAREVPKEGKLVANPYKKWSEIDKSLPDMEITVYGPPPTSGTRDAFVELVMDKACKDFPEYKTAYTDEKEYKKRCQMLREDGKFIEAGENDNLIIQKVKTNPGYFGILGHSYFEENMGVIKAAKVDGIDPTTENISSGLYPVSRLLYVYFKLAHKDFIPGLSEFAKSLTSEKAMGENGYMLDEGLVPLPVGEREKQREVVKEGRAFKL